MTKTDWAVDLIESERGWGQRVDDTIMFTDYDEALEYVKKFNAQNTAPSAPDWYMYATDPRPITREI